MWVMAWRRNNSQMTPAGMPAMTTEIAETHICVKIFRMESSSEAGAAVVVRVVISPSTELTFAAVVFAPLA
eukprot:CAMPEP_0175443574 /NCGR_PEP_ID=MMETSP0095-20121207/58751_1 /TAXON_ID=311494 /ORGANISM="Alexandrium monilatum, Strain CCMP3105" /LENGTH=70 /DNA_ID=CAMNT_0016743673 /DNA_START=458 /DNA_END=666 /DNA_ORIENTATION=-